MSDYESGSDSGSGSSGSGSDSDEHQPHEPNGAVVVENEGGPNAPRADMAVVAAPVADGPDQMFLNNPIILPPQNSPPLTLIDALNCMVIEDLKDYYGFKQLQRTIDLEIKYRNRTPQMMRNMRNLMPAVMFREPVTFSPAFLQMVSRRIGALTRFFHAEETSQLAQQMRLKRRVRQKATISGFVCAVMVFMSLVLKWLWKCAVEYFIRVCECIKRLIAAAAEDINTFADLYCGAYTDDSIFASDTDDSFSENDEEVSGDVKPSIRMKSLQHVEAAGYGLTDDDEDGGDDSEEDGEEERA